MKAFLRIFLMVFLVAAFIVTPNSGLTPSARAAVPQCVDSIGPGSAYTATVCISTPTDGDTLNGDTTITGTVSVTGTNPGVRRMVFFLNNGITDSYLLTGYSAPITFTLPVARWVDGSYTLEVEAVMKDGFVTSQESISLTFATGTTVPPVNNNTFHPTSGTAPATGMPLIVAAVGDAAGGEPNAASVTNLISSMNPNLFLYLGDVYEKGSVAEYYNWYAPSTYFGRFKAITDPTVGNHDYGTGDSSAYRYYWDNVPDYYSFDAGGWHIISLNSYSQFIQVGPTSAEYQWLQTDLANNTSPCTLAFYHHPYLSIGQEGGRPDMVDIWQLLANNHVTLVLNGHDHEYQRWQPLDASGNVSPTGMVEFVVATGGHSLETLTGSDSRVAFASDANPLTFGALELGLRPDYATFDYKSISGATLDQGVIPCKGSGAQAVRWMQLPLAFR